MQCNVAQIERPQEGEGDLIPAPAPIPARVAVLIHKRKKGHVDHMIEGPIEMIIVQQETGKAEEGIMREGTIGI